MDRILAEKVSFAYEGAQTYAVEDVTLKVEQGEWISIIGHNGSGKSTLIKLLNGLFLPTSGEVYVDGMSTKDDGNIWNLRRRVGMVFQNPDNQLVANVVEEDVAFGLENLGVPPEEIRRKVDMALALVGMEQYAGTAPHMLSGGQKQRVAIAGVLAMEPGVLLMDEPTAMLDPAGRREVMQTVQKLHREKGITVVHVTHFMQEALVADRVLCMDKGTVVKQGKPREVFTDVPALKKLGLEAPPMAELGFRLREKGLELPQDIMTIDEMTQALKALGEGQVQA